MDEELLLLMEVIQSGSIFAPFLFILFHIARQLLFIPVALVCIMGGVLFGTIAGTIYSIFGLTLSSLFFYWCFSKLPKMTEKLMRMKNKLFGNRKLNVRQIAVLRLIPFIHFHLLSLCLLETKKNLKDYTLASFFTNIPLAFIYTVFGISFREINPTLMIIILLGVSILFYLVREKEAVISWQEFFQRGK